MKRQLQSKKRWQKTWALNISMFSFMISGFLTSIIYSLWGGTPCILSGATYYRGPASWQSWLLACHLIGPFLVVILSLRMESHSPTTTFQPKWKRDFFSPMPLPSTYFTSWPTQNTIILANLLYQDLSIFEFFLASLISTSVGIAIEH